MSTQITLGNILAGLIAFALTTAALGALLWRAWRESRPPPAETRLRMAELRLDAMEHRIAVVERDLHARREAEAGPG